jgi:DNA-binding CsgD family transcriptional regulator
LRGEAGIGKTALLDIAAEQAAGCKVVRASAAESEMELAFAGLHLLCASLLDGVGHLPEPQREALTTAFGLRGGEPPDRFLVGLAVLSLFSHAAESEPLICLIDDGQWLDSISARTLSFVARRLVAEPVAMLFAVRSGDVGADLAGLPEMHVAGLSDVDARALLDSSAAGPRDDVVREQLVVEARGNPLALLELPRHLPTARFAGAAAADETLPWPGRLEQGFLARLTVLSEPTQLFLLAAAAEPTGDLPLLLRAVDLLGSGPEASAEAEATGLIEFGARVTFRHPLARSAIYRSGDVSRRRIVHGALADATDATADPDRRAWHRALAASGPDEAIAEQLAESAERARARGGVSTAAELLRRAAALTPEPASRLERLLAAAQTTFDAGEPEAAEQLLAVLRSGSLDEEQRARTAWLHARVEFMRSRGADATGLLLAAARQLHPLDRESSREAYLESLGAVIFAGRLGGGHDVQEVAEAGRAAPSAPEPARLTDLLLDGVATRFTDGYVAGVKPLKRALGAFQQGTERDDENIMRWLWLACPVAPEPIAPELWDYDTWFELANRAVQLARNAGALAALPVALSYRAGVHVHAGEFARAAALIEESDALAEAAGHPPLRYTALMLVAWQGDETRALRTIEAAVRDANARGEGRALGLAGYATAVLHNGHGRYSAALAHARQACAYEDLGFLGWSLVELIEAAARSGTDSAAERALAQLTERAEAAGTQWSLGILARSRALVGEGNAAEGLYRESVERLAQTPIQPQLARSHLVFGEWLRREQRRREAREQLHLAYEMFGLMGAEAFADRAGRELEATGETVRKRTAPTPGDVELTAQEQQVARLAREGLTNPEIGARLFLSPHTVDWHLRKVFSKLGIRSRKQLRSLPPESWLVPTAG